jgi:cyclopropane-fatty-acyl-phospholipid synthase
LREAVLSRLANIKSGRLCLSDASESFAFGEPEGDGLDAEISVRDPRFYQQLALGGGLGAAEAYIRGYWDSADLTTAMRVLAQNMETLSGMERGVIRLLRPFRFAANWMRRNTRTGSKRNISAHYDLSNAFFGLMLDPTMTYSSGVFPTPTSTLKEASTEKYDRICRKLKLSPADHVLEIGTGWGGFAEHAVRNYGCRVTTTTISDQQYDYAQNRFRTLSLEDQITLLKKDYRDLSGEYDKLVSIEMIEAVGKKFLPTYFSKCSKLLKKDGVMLLQAIMIPDHRYENYSRSVDFIQRYVFPGGFLPSFGAITECVAKETDFRFFHCEDFGPHYAETLACWRRNFWSKIAEVQSLGFDARFIRIWHYYLCYCEAGFRERQIGVAQLMLTKPSSRIAPTLST